jgi:hypothetical protein
VRSEDEVKDGGETSRNEIKETKTCKSKESMESRTKCEEGKWKET